MNENNPQYLLVQGTDGKEVYLYNQGLTTMAYQESGQYNTSVYIRKVDEDAVVEIALMDLD